MNVPNIKLNSGHQMPQFGLGVWQANDQEATAAVMAALRDGYRWEESFVISKVWERVDKS